MNLQGRMEDWLCDVLNTESGLRLDQSGGKFVRNGVWLAASRRLDVEFLHDLNRQRPQIIG